MFIPALGPDGGATGAGAEEQPQPPRAGLPPAAAADARAALPRRGVKATPVERYLRPGTLQLPALPPLSLYVHLPWCLKKCPYCDFNSTLTSPRAPGRRWRGPRSPIERATSTRCAPTWRRRCRWCGAGRWSASSSAAARPACSRPTASSGCWPTSVPACRWCPTAKSRSRPTPAPSSATASARFRAAGVTRLSIGVQSFDDAALQAIGRVHDAAQARAAVEEARAAFDTFNIDLMYALPGQSLAMLDADLDAALAFAPPHLSVYHLTLEPNTWFATHPPALPDADLASDMLDRIVQRTGGCGAAALRGVGLRAHGSPLPPQPELLALRRLPGHRRRRARQAELSRTASCASSAGASRRPTSTQALAGEALSQDAPVPRAELPFEFMLNALRLRDGFELRAVHASAPACRLRPSTPRWRRRSGAACCSCDAAAGAADDARFRLPQRSAGDVPAAADSGRHTEQRGSLGVRD